MAAPVFFIDPAQEAAVGAVVSVTGPEGHHAAQVARLRSGEAVELVDGQGRRVVGRVGSVAKDRIDVDVLAVSVEAGPCPRLVIVQALPKGERAERAVEMMTEVGVDVIVAWSAANCVTRWSPERAQRGLAKWRSIARAATKQSRRARTMEIADLHATADLGPWITGAAKAVILDEGADAPLAAMTPPASGDVCLIVGPEGGIAPAERDQLVALGAVPARLGPSVLRTSTAGAVAAAVVLSRTARWGGAGC